METTKTSKVRKTMTLTVAERADWISQFNAKSSFPSKDVPCSSCNEGITMFGTNLKNRVSRYDSVEDFLDTFVCRTCKGKAKRGEKVENVQAVANTHTEEDHEIIEDSYVVEPGDDDEVVSEQHEVIDDTADIEVFDDSDEVESREVEEDEEVEEIEESDETVEVVESEDVSEEITSFDDDSQEEDEEHQPVNTDAIREKYKAFYAMKR